MKKLLTTGEVAELLGISRLTVQRKFDRGEFWGRRNPVTGKRLISRECVESFLKEAGLASRLSGPQKRVLLCTADDRLDSLVRSALATDRRVQMERAGAGADALIRCAKDPPALVVLDDQVSDIAPRDFIAAVRRAGIKEEMKVLLVTSEGAAGEYLEWGADACVSREGLDEQSLAAALYPALGLEGPDERSTEPTEHRRRWPRFRVNLPVQIEVYPLASPTKTIRGEARVRNISREGAFLMDVRLESDTLPTEPFGVRLLFDQPPFVGWRLESHVVRLQFLSPSGGPEEGVLSMGVAFDGLPARRARRLERLLG